MPLITCMCCGIQRESRYSTTKFCSDACRRKYNGSHKGRKQTCEQCMRVFMEYKKRRFCSADCNKRYHMRSKEERESQEEKNKKLREIVKLRNVISTLCGRVRECTYCGREFIMIKNKTGFKYCSESCKGMGYQKVRNRSRKRVNKDERLRKNGKVDHSITLRKLYNRDKGICHICNKSTDYNDYIVSDEGHFIAGDMYPSIDHVLPIASGGLHQWQNVRLAHRLCNSIKRDRVDPPSLRMEGLF